MIRTERDTGTWFKNDDKGLIKDKKHNAAMAPGMYNPRKHPLGDKKKHNSYNFGTVPFGTQYERFTNDYMV